MIVIKVLRSIHASQVRSFFIALQKVEKREISRDIEIKRVTRQREIGSGKKLKQKRVRGRGAVRREEVPFVGSLTYEI